MCWKSKKRSGLVTSGGLFVALFAIAMVWIVPAQAAPTNVPITGEIERLTLDVRDDIYSGGRIIVGGYSVILPKNLLIDLPANRLTLQQIFLQAPAGCVATLESGLAKTDTCNVSGTGGFATITAVRTNAGDVIAGDVFIQKGTEAVTGTVTYISYTDGYFRLNGITNDPATGVMVRLNDPTSRHTIQTGLGCAGGPNCSPDPRFTIDPDNYTNTFATGYPLCIPSTVSRATQTALPAAGSLPAIPAGTVVQAAADGSGDLLCPLTNRTPGAALEPAVADSRRFAPIIIGDSLIAEGNFETIGGVRFLSTHTINVQKALSTSSAPGQPDYLFLEEVFIAAPGFENQRANALFIGFTTLAPTDVDIWSIHRDPANNDMHEFPLATVRGCDGASGALGSCSSQGLVNAGLNIFRLRYDVDFLLARTDPSAPGGARPDLNPCLQLINAASRFRTSGVCPGGATLSNNIGVMSPVPHEIIARTGRRIDSPAGSLITIDINGAEATNGEYLFPLGFNLGGIEGPEFAEIDLNQLSKPTIFEGIPWNLDRRLSPSGCLNNAGDPVACPAGPIPLDPFPFTGLDPRTQADVTVGVLTGGLPTGLYTDAAFTASALSEVRNRIFSFVDGNVGRFDGDATVLPCGTGVFPANCPPDPPREIISTPTPTFPIAFTPVDFAGSARAQNDLAKTRTSVPVSIPVLSNDVVLAGQINFASVTVVSPASHGTAVANVDGTVNYTPGPGYSGGDSFTYTFSELTSGEVSNVATVAVVVRSLATGSFTSGAAVGINDALKAIHMAVGLVMPTEEDLLNGDVAPLGAPDGRIGVDDALLILKKAAGLVNF